MKNYKQNKGITLISLVVTIVILLILVGVSISVVLGDNGIVKKVQEAKDKTEIGENRELEKLNSLEQLISQYTKLKGKITTIKYYTSLLTAIDDANNDVVTNGGDDSSGAKAKIEIDENGNAYVLPLEDATLDTIVQVGSIKGYTLDLNNKTLTFSEGSHFNQLAGTKLILDDSGTNGNVTKNVNSSYSQNIIRSSGELALNGGIYNLTNNGTGVALNFRMDKATFITNGGTISCINKSSGKATAIQISGSNSTTTINNVNCSAKTVSGLSRGLFATASDQNDEDSNITINGGEFTSFSESNKTEAAYFMYKNVTINEGIFNAESNTSNSNSVGIRMQGRNDITINDAEVNSNSNGYALGIYFEGSEAYGEPKFIINNAKVNASINNSDNFVYGIYSVGINQNECKINDGKYYIDSNRGKGYSMWIDKTNVEINNGEFIADGAFTKEGVPRTCGLCSESKNLVVNGGYFRGNYSGAIVSDTGYINGGTFESPTIGGIDARGNVSIKNATFKLGTYKGVHSEIVNTRHSGMFCIGTTKNESKVYMDNVTLISDFGSKPAFLSSDTNNKDTYLYVSNTAFPGSISVDGTRSNSQNPTAQGHLYVGKNVTYSEITTGSGSTTGIVDTITYANKEFLHD